MIYGDQFLIHKKSPPRNGNGTILFGKADEPLISIKLHKCELSQDSDRFLSFYICRELSFILDTKKTSQSVTSSTSQEKNALEWCFLRNKTTGSIILAGVLRNLRDPVIRYPNWQSNNLIFFISESVTKKSNFPAAIGEKVWSCSDSERTFKSHTSAKQEKINWQGGERKAEYMGLVVQKTTEQRQTRQKWNHQNKLFWEHYCRFVYPR